MKICPSCKTQYTDDTLAFCLQDGTRLVAPETVSPTIALRDGPKTVARDRDADTTRWQQSEVTRISQPVERKKGSNGLLIVVLIVGLLVILSIGSAALLWFVLLPNKTIANNVAANTPTPTPNTNIFVNNANRPVTPTPTPNTNLNVAFPTPSPTPAPVDPTIIRSEVAGSLEGWENATESLNLNSLMSYYAGTVDYYRRGPTSAAFVRNDKQRAFSRFSSISITISNMEISVDASGYAATARFDKEWVFEGARTSTGKVRSQLQFKKINAEWMITGERDLSVYYTN